MTEFIDTEDVLCDALTDLGTTGTVTPDDLEEHLPFIRVTRVGGTDDHHSDYPRIDIDVFAMTRAQAHQVSEQVRDRIRFGHVVPGVDYVSTESSPQMRPWDNTDLRRVGATYRVTTRRT